MNKQQLVTRRQAIKLKQLGFHDKTCAYTHENAQDLNVRFSYPYDHNRWYAEMKERPFISVPTVYEALDWLNAKKSNQVLTIIPAFTHGKWYISCRKLYVDGSGFAAYRIGKLYSNKYAAYREAINILIKEYEKH